MKNVTCIACITFVLFCVASIKADVFNMQTGSTSLKMVPVGNPGNAGELSGPSAGGDGWDRICGAVNYTYRIGKYEVTAGQYCEFLNAVAKTDTYGLYNLNMDTDVYSKGCNIKRTGSSGSYSYSIAADWANRPVNFVSWGDIVRFANWLQNGQPVGSQDLTTTEDGSYYLNGATSMTALAVVTRKTSARWVIPNDDEWYKAAYHKNDGITGNYFDYPTSSDTIPSNYLINPDPGNNANFENGGTLTIGGPYFRTVVGEFENSLSPYGTYDQGGNIHEWNESLILETQRISRGGAYNLNSHYIHANNFEATNTPPYHEFEHAGFRVAEIPLIPANDEKSNASFVQIGVPMSESTLRATGTDITRNGYNDCNDVWYYFEPVTKGNYTIQLYNSTFDTTLAVFDQQDREVMFNDDFFGEKSLVILKAKAGKRYYIRVAGCDAETGDFTMNIQQGSVQAFQGDLNYDGNVNMDDFAAFAENWMIGS